MNDPEEILARLFEGDASDEELKSLVGMLRGDAALRRRFRCLASVHGQLGVVMEGELAKTRRVERVMEVIREVDGEVFAAGVTKRLRVTRWARRSLAVAVAAVLMLVGLGVWQMGLKDPMATLQRVENLKWGGVEAYEEGERLQVGAVLDFRSGLLELELDGRGRMVVEGPAHLEFPKAGLAVLKRGRVVMRATEKGHGYRVETPRGSVIDLGTEFGVSVGADGMVETHVLEGSVEAVGDNGERVTLLQDDGLRFGEKGNERIEMDGGQFYTVMPPMRDQSLSYIHWPLDEGSGLFSEAIMDGLGSGGSEMVFHAMDQGVAPSWVKGEFGAGLNFDGKGGFAESRFPGVGGNQARTICFWVKVPDDFSLKEGFAVVSWGKFDLRKPGEVWQVSVNPLKQDGPIGRLRVGVHKGQVVGETDLRDGKWHHVAVVLYGGSRPNVGTHVMLYVDGQPEVVSRRALPDVRTKIEEVGHGVWLGRNVTYTHSDPDHLYGGFFRGGVDELYIFDSALSRSQLMEVMTANQVPK